MSRCLFVTESRSTTSYALLGLLALREWTTYELAKQVQRSIGWFWPRAERKLYEEPKRLVEARLGDRDGGDDRSPAAHRLRRHGGGAAGAAALARRAAGAADARVRGNGEGVLRRRRDARAATGHARSHRRACRRPPRRAGRKGRRERSAATLRFPTASTSTTSGSVSSSIMNARFASGHVGRSNRRRSGPRRPIRAHGTTGRSSPSTPLRKSRREAGQGSPSLSTSPTRSTPVPSTVA